MKRYFKMIVDEGRRKGERNETERKNKVLMGKEGTNPHNDGRWEAPAK